MDRGAGASSPRAATTTALRLTPIHVPFVIRLAPGGPFEDTQTLSPQVRAQAGIKEIRIGDGYELFSCRFFETTLRVGALLNGGCVKSYPSFFYRRYAEIIFVAAGISDGTLLSRIQQS